LTKTDTSGFLIALRETQIKPQAAQTNESIDAETSESSAAAASAPTNYENAQNYSNSSTLSQDPRLLKAVEESIENLILRSIEASQRGSRSDEVLVIDQSIITTIAVEAARIYEKTCL